MRVGIANTQVPFVRGGAERLAESLRDALQAAGHEAEIVSVPFKWYPAERILDHMLACRLMLVDEFCGTRIDRLVGLKFPAYLMPHPSKVMWLVHQYRGAYDAWDTPIGDLINQPQGVAVRQAIRTADEALLGECRAIYTISRNVSRRLLDHNGLDSTPLYHPPPGAERIRPGEYGEYVLMPSRIDRSKRQELVVEALALTRAPVRLLFLGGGNDPEYEAALRGRCAEAGLDGRVQWLGAVEDAEKLARYAGCLAVAFPPLDEDYGYVTLEAMLAAKAVITCADAGGPLDFVLDGETGLVCAPEPAAIAEALDRLWADRALAERLGRAALDRYRALDLGWHDVVQRLTA